MKKQVLVLMGLVLGLVLALAPTAAASGFVDLEWQVVNDRVQVGDIVRVELRAKSTTGVDEPFTIIEVPVRWNPEHLTLVGVDDNGPYDWRGWSWFPPDGGLDGMNETFDDGDADYQAWGMSSEFPVATVEGLLITTFEFVALAETEATSIEMLREYGWYSVSAVYDDLYGGWNIVDEIDCVSVTIEPRDVHAEQTARQGEMRSE